MLKKHYLLFIFLWILTCQIDAHTTDMEEVLKKFQTYAENALKESKTPGMSIAIVRQGKVVFAKGFGVKTWGTQEKVDENTIFQIGSISKSFTSALIAQAVTHKYFKWQDLVIDHWPEFRLYDPWVTRAFQIEDTLAQRSGLPAYAGDGQLLLGYSNEQMMNNVRYIEPETSFRANFAYQNIFFNIAAKVLALKTKKPWDQWVNEKLLKPLDMTQTSANYEGFLKATNVTSLHAMNAKGNPEVIKKTDLISAVYVYAPAGGINSNSLDMAKWLIFQLNLGKLNEQQMISQEDMQKTHTAHIPTGNWNGMNSYYCLGWILSLYPQSPMIWHNGGTNGCSSMAAILPNENLGIVILTNMRGPELHHALALQFFDLYFNKNSGDWNQRLTLELKEKQQKNKISLASVKVPSLPLKNYVGTYTNPIYGPLVVKESLEALHLILNDGKIDLTLKHFDHDTFEVLWDAEDHQELDRANFCFDAKGQPKSLTIEALGPGNQGTFNYVPPDG